jgi:hypothetical protein
MLHALIQLNSMTDIVRIVAVLAAFVAVVVALAGTWRVYEKAGQPGWASLVPIYNIIVLLRIAGERWWCILLMAIPGVNAVVYLLLCIDVAKRFGRGALFGLGLCWAGALFFPILGFGNAQYQKPA